MKSRIVALALACALTTPSFAQSSTELAEIRAQLEQLIERVDRLERENSALRNEKAQLEQAKTQTTAAASSPEAARWTDRIAIKSDLRYRHDRTDDEMAADVRNREQLRARVSLEAQATENVQVVVGIATSDNGNPRGANVALDGELSRKSLDFDLGYFDWSVGQGFHVVGGKMRMPFYRPGQSLFWDNDVNPEGLAVKFSRGHLFGSAYGFWIDENVPQVGSTPTKTDTMLYGGQFGVGVPFGDSMLTLAAMYYDLSGAKGYRPFFGGSSNGNSTLGTGSDAVLAHDFRVASLSAEFKTKLGALPLSVWADAARNMAASLDTAYTLGALIGKADAANTWEAGIAYQVIEKDALFAQHIDSDFGGGDSDSSGWVLRAGYAPMKNLAFNVSYFLTTRNMDVGEESDFERLLVDFNLKY